MNGQYEIVPDEYGFAVWRGKRLIGNTKTRVDAESFVCELDAAYAEALRDVDEAAARVARLDDPDRGGFEAAQTRDGGWEICAEVELSNNKGDTFTSALFAASREGGG